MLHAEDVFERTNGALHSGTSGVQIIPLRTAAQDAGIEAQISIGIDVNTASVFRRGARILAVAAEGTAME